MSQGIQCTLENKPDLNYLGKTIRELPIAVNWPMGTILNFELKNIKVNILNI